MHIRSVVIAAMLAAVLTGCAAGGSSNGAEANSSATTAKQCSRIPSNEFTHARDSMFVSRVGVQLKEDGFEIAEIRRMSDDERYRQQLGAECEDVFAVLRTFDGLKRVVMTQRLGTVYVGRVAEDGRWVFCEGSGLPSYREVLDRLALDTPQNPARCDHATLL